MKKTLKMIAVISFAAIVTFALLGCGGKKDTPEGLAKQQVDLINELQKAYENDDPEKAEQVRKEIQELGAIVEKLSDEDREKFDMAVWRLTPREY